MKNKLVDKLIDKFTYEELHSMVGYGDYLLKENKWGKEGFEKDELKREVKLLKAALREARLVEAI